MTIINISLVFNSNQFPKLFVNNYYYSIVFDLLKSYRFMTMAAKFTF